METSHLLSLVVLALALIFLGSGSATNLDTICDCDDEEALYYRSVRQLLQLNGTDSWDDFLSDFRPRPVCGSDGVTYRTRCELHCTQLKSPDLDLYEARRWKCRKSRISQRRKAVASKLKLKRKTPPESKVMERMEHPHVCICPRNYFPVCASNGISYGNRCTFQCAKHNLSPDITIVSTGKCNEDDKTFI